MKIGVPSEIKTHEYRVGLTPESVEALTRSGHDVFVQSDAGRGIGADNNVYEKAGAKILASADDVFDAAKLIVKVKEPQAIERRRLRPEHILFTYLHLAPDPEQTNDLLESRATCIAYETVTDNKNGLPLLRPMSQVAGRLSIQAGALALESSKGGRGLLLGGVPGVSPADVVILGGGVVGYHAAQMAVGLGARVTILDKNPEVLETLSTKFENRVRVLHASPALIEQILPNADLIIGAVLLPGATSPKLVSKSFLSKLRPGTVLVDVAIDQGGCFETSRPTTHDDPTYIIDDVVHYCVANMPGAVARTSTYALNMVTLPYVLELADKGWRKALLENEHLLNGLSVHRGQLGSHAVANALGLDALSPNELIHVD